MSVFSDIASSCFLEESPSQECLDNSQYSPRLQATREAINSEIDVTWQWSPKSHLTDSAGTFRAKARLKPKSNSFRKHLSHKLGKAYERKQSQNGFLKIQEELKKLTRKPLNIEASTGSSSENCANVDNLFNDSDLDMDTILFTCSVKAEELVNSGTETKENKISLNSSFVRHNSLPESKKESDSKSTSFVRHVSMPPSPQCNKTGKQQKLTNAGMMIIVYSIIIFTISGYLCFRN